MFPNLRQAVGLFLLVGATTSWGLMPGAISDSGTAPAAAVVDTTPALIPPPLFDDTGSVVGFDSTPPSKVRLKKSPPKVSVTLAPVMLLLSIPELTIEYQTSSNSSFALMGGAGSGTIEDDDGSGRVGYSVRELGAQYRHYGKARSGKGFHAGLQAYWLRLDLGFSDSEFFGGFPLYGGADFIVAGPFIGYKIRSGSGFTIEYQIGYQGSYAVQLRDVGPGLLLTNFNIGWSF